MSENVKNSGNDIEERNFDFKRFALKYIKLWYVFAITVTIGFFAARYYNWYSTPIYKASCRIIIKDENSNSSTENILKDLSNMKRNVNLENEIQIFKSKTLNTKAINELELSVSYILLGNIKSSELYNKSPFILKADTLNEFAYFKDLDITIINQNSFNLIYKLNKKDADKISKHNFGENIINDFGKFKIVKRESFDNVVFNDPTYNKKKYRVHFNSIENLANYYASSLGVDIVSSGSSILELSIIDGVPEVCSDYLNKLTEVYIINSSEQQNLLASNSIKFIDSQILQISGELKDIEKTLLEFQTKKGIINVDDESKLFLERVKTFDEKISENKIQIASEGNTLKKSLQYPDKKEYIRKTSELNFDHSKNLKEIEDLVSVCASKSKSE